MALSAFGKNDRPPGESDLRATLGKAHPAWDGLRALVAERLGPITELWAFTSATTGWGLRLRHKDRVILYMTPQQNRFLVSFVLGEQAVAVAQDARLPAWVLSAITEAPRYAEGRGVRVTVTSRRQISSLVALAQVKKQH